MENLYPKKNNKFSMKDIIELYNRYPELREINKSIIQKKF